MKRKNVLALTVVFALAVGAFLLTALGRPTQAQQPCAPFQAIIHGSLPTPNPFAPTDTWGGPIYVSLGGEALLGTISGNDGEVSVHGTIATGRRGSYKVCFPSPGCTDSFTYEVPNAVWPVPRGKVGFGDYKAQGAKIAQGAGRFRSASGKLNVAGPFILWRPDGGTTWLGRWNGEISGNICGVQ